MSTCQDIANLVPSWTGVQSDVLQMCELVVADAISAEASAVTAVEDVVSTVSTAAQGIGNGALQKIINDIATLAQKVPVARMVVDAPQQWFDFLASQSAAVATILDSSKGPAAQAQAASNWLSWDSNGAYYNLINDTQYTDAADELAIATFALPILAQLASTFGPTGPLWDVAVAINVSDRPTPYLKVLRDATQFVVKPPSTDVAKLAAVSKLGSDFIQAIVAFPVTPATALIVGVLILSNLPQPPYGTIIEHILKDQLFQKNLRAHGVSWQVTKRFIPAVIACYEASDANTFLTCAKGFLDAAFPGLVAKLAKQGVRLTDVRTVVQALWDAGGDPSVAFDEDLNPSAVEALLSLGIGGLVALLSVFAPGVMPKAGITSGPFSFLVGTSAGAKLLDLIDYFELITAALGDTNSPLDQVNFPSSPVQAVLDALNSVSWDLPSGLALMSTQGLFDGAIGTPQLDALVSKINFDPNMASVAEGLASRLTPKWPTSTTSGTTTPTTVTKTTSSSGSGSGLVVTQQQQPPASGGGSTWVPGQGITVANLPSAPATDPNSVLGGALLAAAAILIA